MVNEGIGENQERSSNGKIDERWLGTFVGSFKAIRSIASREVVAERGVTVCGTISRVVRYFDTSWIVRFYES